MSTLVSKYCWKPLEFYFILSSNRGAWMIRCKCIYQVAVMMSYRIQPYMLVYSDFLTSNHVSGFEEQTMSWTVLALYKRLWIALQFGVHKMYYRELALHHHQNHCNLDYLISIPGSSCQLLKHILTCLVMNNHLQLWVRSHSWFSSSETTCSEVQQALLWQAELHHIQISICWNCRQNNRQEHSRRSTIGPANICKQHFKNHRLSFGVTIGLLWNFLTSRNEKSVQ
jgi:hypothetical protein